MLIADAREHQAAQFVQARSWSPAYQAGSGQESQKNWIDVALDPNRQDFWGVDAGFSRLAKPDGRALTRWCRCRSQLTSVPRGVAVNGELRAAQTVRIVDLSLNTAGRATFLEGTTSAHSWSGKVPVSAFFAVQAMETCYSSRIPRPRMAQICAAGFSSCASTLDIRPRLHNFDSTATPKQDPHVTERQYTGRAVFYREILRTLIRPPRFGRVRWTTSAVFKSESSSRGRPTCRRARPVSLGTARRPQGQHCYVIRGHTICSRLRYAGVLRGG